MTLRSVEALAMKLPAASRGKLAAKLLSTLSKDGSPENERMWIDEAGRRVRAYKPGRTGAADRRQSVPAANVVLRAQKALERFRAGKLKTVSHEKVKRDLGL